MKGSVRPIRRWIYAVICATLALVLLSPPALYWLGLNGVEGRPPKPLHLASTNKRALVWKQARGTGVPHIAPDNPYSFAANVLYTKGASPPGRIVAWWVARDYLMRHRRHEEMIWWHLSGAALTIWLSRNWTSEEILSAASELPRSPAGR